MRWGWALLQMRSGCKQVGKMGMDWRMVGSLPCAPRFIGNQFQFNWNVYFIPIDARILIQLKHMYRTDGHKHFN